MGATSSSSASADHEACVTAGAGTTGGCSAAGAAAGAGVDAGAAVGAAGALAVCVFFSPHAPNMALTTNVTVIHLLDTSLPPLRAVDSFICWRKHAAAVDVPR